MAKYTIEVRQIWEINAKEGEEWGDLLDLSQKRWWQDEVEIDAVTLLSSNTEVIEIESEADDV
jgi:hypothetical protein